MRRGLALFVGMIETPFEVDQEEYFRGLRDPEDPEDEELDEGEAEHQ